MDINERDQQPARANPNHRMIRRETERQGVRAELLDSEEGQRAEPFGVLTLPLCAHILDSLGWSPRPRAVSYP